MFSLPYRDEWTCVLWLVRHKAIKTKPATLIKEYNMAADSQAARPPKTAGMHHVALNVEDIDSCERFYVDLLGMSVEWRPNAENVYLCSGSDNLALHKVDQVSQQAPQRLDHIGFIVKSPEDVDAWYQYLRGCEVPVPNPPTRHRDGASSFYCRDPAGNVVQMIYHPPLVNG